MRFLATLVVLALAVLALREYQAEQRNQEARRFIESLIPKLRAYKTGHGRYPEAIPTDWYAGKAFPPLLRPDFYMSFENGQEFLMRFRDTRVDPRFFWNDIVAYQSNIGHWDQWDGY